MGALLALAIFVFVLRFLTANKTSVLTALIIAGVTTVIGYTVLAEVLNGFVRALGSIGVTIVLILFLIVGIAVGGGYILGRIKGSSEDPPFRPF